MLHIIMEGGRKVPLTVIYNEKIQRNEGEELDIKIT